MVEPYLFEKAIGQQMGDLCRLAVGDAESAETFRPALWYPTLYRGLTSARYLIKQASGAKANFNDAIAAPLVGLRVALPWRSEGYDAVEVSLVGYDSSTKWGGIQDDVITGDAVSKYPVGTEIEDTWGEYTAPWTVVNHYANGDMALQWKYATPNSVQFDAPEAIYYADASGLAAGTYHIAIGTNYKGWSTSKHIQFTLTRAMVEGDQLFIDCANNNENDPSAGRAWRVYHAGGTTVLESGTTSNGEEGTLLGVIGNVNTELPNGQLNAITRVIYGYDRWSQSALRQYLNSAARNGKWWVLKNPWDRPPSQHATLDGFLSSFTEEFLAALKEVDVVTAIGGSAAEYETTQDKIFLPSLQEMYFIPQLADVEGEDWDYYKTLAAEAGLSNKFAKNTAYEVLKKYSLASQTSSVAVWLRSCSSANAYATWAVNSSGGVYANFAHTAYWSCPACIIKKSVAPTKKTINLPTTIYGGYLDAVTGQLVATHDENGNPLANQKLYFLPPINIDALAGTNFMWSDAGDVMVSYRVGDKDNPEATRNDVNFYDYDGTIVTSYSAAGFAELTELPPNPTHEGLTAQGWNWTLADAKTYVASYGKLNVGQMYITDDGKTRIYIRLEEGRLSPYLGIAINGTATVEWGDGTSDTVTGSDTTTVVNTQHTYAAAGDYVIAIAVSGSMTLVGNSSYGSQVLWKNTTPGITSRPYQNAIKKIEIGANTSFGENALRNCNALASITIPSSVTSIGYGMLNSCYGLTSVTIPNSAADTGYGAFYNCYSLASITIPDSVTTISNSSFSGCCALTSVTIPDSVTTIDGSAFYNSYSLASITIPSSVTRINASAFGSCYGLGYIKFVGTTPPTVPNSNAWGSVPTDCIIYVPRGSLSAYTSAANYPSSSDYTYVEY